MPEHRNDLGWVNEWYDNPPKEYTNCRELKHPLKDADIARIKMRGLDTLYWCDLCCIQWHVDSSD
jgi:hypothetical protein